MVALCGVDTGAPDTPFTKDRLDEAIDDAENAKVWGKSQDGDGDDPTDVDGEQ